MTGVFHYANAPHPTEKFRFNEIKYWNRHYEKKDPAGARYQQYWFFLP
jgi:hypothetical protein